MKKILLIIYCLIPSFFCGMEVTQESMDLKEELLTLTDADLKRLFNAQNFFPFPKEILDVEEVTQNSKDILLNPTIDQKLNKSQIIDQQTNENDEQQILYYSFCRFCHNYIYNRSLNNKDSFKERFLSKHKKRCKKKCKYPSLRDIEIIKEKTIPKSVIITKALKSLMLAYNDGKKIIIMKK